MSTEHIKADVSTSGVSKAGAELAGLKGEIDELAKDKEAKIEVKVDKDSLNKANNTIKSALGKLISDIKPNKKSGGSGFNLFDGLFSGGGGDRDVNEVNKLQKGIGAASGVFGTFGDVVSGLGKSLMEGVGALSEFIDLGSMFPKVFGAGSDAANTFVKSSESVGEGANSASKQLSTLMTGAGSLTTTVLGLAGTLAMGTLAFLGIGAAVVVVLGVIMALVGMILMLATSLASLLAILTIIPAALLAISGAAVVLLLPLKALMPILSQIMSDQKDTTKTAVDLTSAYHSLAQAEKAVVEATKALADARAAYAGDLKSSSRDVTQAQLDERSAIRALTQAQKDLNSAQEAGKGMITDITRQTDAFSGKIVEIAHVTGGVVSAAQDQQAAQDRVLQSQLNLDRAKERTSETEKNYQKLLAGGVEGSDKVVAAHERLADAQYNLAQSQKSLADQQKRTSDSADKLNEAIGKLSPAGQALVNFIKGPFMTALDSLSLALQEGLFPGILEGLEQLSKVLSDDDVVKMLSELAKAFGELFSSGLSAFLDQIPRLKPVFDAIVRFISGLSGKARPIADALTDIALASLPLVENIGDFIGILADMFVEFASGGDMKEWIDFAIENFNIWFDIIKTIWDIFGDLFEAARPFALLLAGEIGEWFKMVAEWLNDHKDELKQFFSKALEASGKIWEFLSKLLFVFMKIGVDALPIIINLFSSLVDALPQLEELGQAFIDMLTPEFIANMILLTVLVLQLMTLFVEKLGPYMPTLVQYFAYFTNGLIILMPYLFDLKDLLFWILAPILLLLDPLDTMKKGFKKITDWMDKEGGNWKKFNDILKTTGDWLKRIWSWADKVFNPLKKVVELLPDSEAGSGPGHSVGENIMNSFTDAIPGGAIAKLARKKLGIKLPFTAAGGIFNGAQPRIIGESGPEAVIPLNDPNRAMQLMQQSGLDRMGASYIRNPSAGGGLSDAQLEATLARVLADRPSVQVNQTFHDNMDAGVIAQRVTGALV